MRPYQRKILNIINSGIYMLLFWGSCAQLLAVIFSSNSAVFFYIFLGGAIPSLMLGILMYFREITKYKSKMWLQESSDEGKGFSVVSFYICLLSMCPARINYSKAIKNKLKQHSNLFSFVHYFCICR